MGVAAWPMVELEADDALASAAHLASKDERVEKVCIWTPDKDLAQCVVGDRVVQVDRRSGRFAMRRGFRRSSGSLRHSSRIILPSSATPPTAILDAGHRSQDGRTLDRPARPSSRNFPRARLARTGSACCSSRRSRRSAPMRRCLTMWSSSDGAVPAQHSLRRRRKSATRVSPREQHARLILDRYEVEILPHSRWRAACGGDARATAIEHRRHRAARTLRSRVGMGAHAGSAVGVLPRRPPLERSLGGHQPQCARCAPGPPRSPC